MVTRTVLDLGKGLSGRHENWSDDGFRNLTEFDLGRGFLKTRHTITDFITHESPITGIAQLTIRGQTKPSTILFSEGTIKDISPVPTQTEIANPLGAEVLYFAQDSNRIFFAGNNTLMYQYLAVEGGGIPTTLQFNPAIADGGKKLETSTAFNVFDNRLVIAGGEYSFPDEALVDNRLFWSEIGNFDNFAGSTFTEGGYLAFQNKISYLAPLRDHLLIIFNQHTFELRSSEFFDTLETYIPNKILSSGLPYSGKTLAIQIDSQLKILLKDGIYDYNHSVDKTEIARSKQFDSTILKEVDFNNLLNSGVAFATDINDLMFMLPGKDGGSVFLTIKDTTIDGYSIYHKSSTINPTMGLWNNTEQVDKTVFSEGNILKIINQEAAIEVTPYTPELIFNPFSLELASSNVTGGSIEVILSNTNMVDITMNLNFYEVESFDQLWGSENLIKKRSRSRKIKANVYRIKIKIPFAETGVSIILGLSFQDITTQIIIHGIVLNF